MRLRVRKKHYSNDPTVQAFFEKHTPHVYLGVQAVFHDGSTALKCFAGWEQMEPGDDKEEYERRKTIVRYLQKIAEDAENEFQDLKGDLVVDSEDGYVNHGDEDEQIAELKALKKKARLAQANVRVAIEEMEEVQPHWITKREQLRAEHAQSNQRFRRRVKSIRL